MLITSNMGLNLTTIETLTLGPTTQNFNDQTTSTLTWVNGTAAGQVDLHCEFFGVTLAAGASATYTLSALADSLGRSVALVKVRALLLSVTARTAGDSLTVGDAAGALAHAWSSPFGGAATGHAVCYDALVLAALNDGFAVAAGSSDQLLLKNTGSHPITFTLSLAGTSV